MSYYHRKQEFSVIEPTNTVALSNASRKHSRLDGGTQALRSIYTDEQTELTQTEVAVLLLSYLVVNTHSSMLLRRDD